MNVILLSGGSGKRLWPLSNDVRSKQFIRIFKGRDGSYESMFQRMYRGIREVCPDAKITIATSKTQVSGINNQLAEIFPGEEANLSVEPCRRDTFPAIALASLYLKDVMGASPDEPVVVCPVDPYVENDYFKALKKLSDTINYCDPVSSDATIAAETELKAVMDEIQQAIVDDDVTSVVPLCKKAEAILAERNRLCKLNK